MSQPTRMIYSNERGSDLRLIRGAHVAYTGPPLDRFDTEEKARRDSIAIKPDENEIRSDVKEIKKRMQEVTVEGFRTLGIVSTFIAGVEAQCLGLTADGDIEDRVVQAINALLLIGLLLSAFGAVTSLLVARWFDLLVREDELRLLDLQWEKARPIVTKFDTTLLEEKNIDRHERFGARPSIQEQIDHCTHRRKNKIVAKAAFVPLNMIAL
ncbi:hypothetical protein FRC07_012302 [Ceratobasidium sp. 392]|nr:hypothetical protein FRC07_012302 [Ceratobasidium sp. 392]